jgi:hypothetical protein
LPVGIEHNPGITSDHDNKNRLGTSDEKQGRLTSTVGSVESTAVNGG